MLNTGKEIESDFNNLVKNIQDAKPYFKSSDYDEKYLIDNYNYILTDNAKKRLNKLYTYITNGIPVLLEGETGCSKTLSAEIICKYIYKKKKEKEEEGQMKAPNELQKYDENDEEFIKFNLSAEVKINDLMQKFIGDKNSLSGLKIVEGPFYRAFKEGKPLILDEINLASEEVLQIIEGTLDSGEINIEISGIGFVNQKKKDGFCLIATQNPNKDNYMNKRQNLSQSFLSHFQIIKFPNFEIEELEEIAKKLFKSFNNGLDGDEKDNKFISDLIAFHKIWTSKEEVKNDITCFTIREIAATVKAYIDESKKNPFKIVKVIYASRYQNNKKRELFELLGNYDTFKEEYKAYMEKGSEFIIPGEIKGLYENESLKEVIESSIFSLEKKRNIIIIGKSGCGKSHIAREIAKIYNIKTNNISNNYYHFICTEETKCSDLIGYHAPKKEDGINQGNIIMEWKEGFLSESIEKGKCVILDNLQEANSTITERLNGLLDIKYDENTKKGTKKKFYIPENPIKNNIIIHDNFRLIGVCDIKMIKRMSPAFLNRFDIIVFVEQFENITNEKFKNLLKIILNRKEELSQIDIEKENEIEMLEKAFGEDDDEDFIIEDKNEEKIENAKEKTLFEKILEDNLDYIVEKFSKLIESYNKNDNNKENNDKNNTLSLFDISRFCQSIKIISKKEEFINEFNDKKNPLDIHNLIDFIYELIFSEKEVQMNKYTQIKKIFFNMLHKLYEEKIQKEEEENQFIFEGNETLENFLSIVFAAFIIHLHLCIIGPPGVGKTTSAKFISELIQNEEESGYKLFNFHRTTKPSDLYGTLNFKKGNVEYYKGPLIESVIKGKIFIADEMNLSSVSTMKSILPILNPLLDNNILIPGFDKPIDIKTTFFFISCQNDADNLGRNYMPEMVQKKLKQIKYPKQKEIEIKNICKKKKKSMKKLKK